MQTFTFTVPGPPVGKQRPRKGKYGNFYTPTESKAYEDQIGYFAKETGMEPVLTVCHLDVRWKRNADGEQELEITLVQTDDTNPRGTYPDGDNVLKSVADGLAGIGYKNDKQVGWWSLGREI